VCETRCINHVAVLSQDKTDISCGGEVNDRWDKIQVSVKVWHPSLHLCIKHGWLVCEIVRSLIHAIPSAFEMGGLRRRTALYKLT